MGWDVAGSDGAGWDGMERDWMGWDGMGEDGMGWDGLSVRNVDRAGICSVGTRPQVPARWTFRTGRFARWAFRLWEAMQSVCTS